MNVVALRMLTGDRVIYRVERDDLPLFVGQQLDVFIEAAKDQRAARR